VPLRDRWQLILWLLLSVSLLAPGTAAAAVTAEECTALTEAYQRLRAGAFEVQRIFTLTVNDDQKNREVAQLSYAAGELETQVLEYKPRSKMFVYENEGKDFILEIQFACERIEVAGQGRYELRSKDGLEVAELEMDGRAGAFRLVGWRSDDTARFLFKKYIIKARAEYSNFQWRQVAGQNNSMVDGPSTNTQPDAVQQPTEKDATNLDEHQ